MREAISDLHSRKETIVGIGPMSLNCVDAIFKYSHDHARPIELIASRRQIESAKLGRGYVNNWTTEHFGTVVAEMRARYPSSQVFVCRDHGGPWQGTGEAGLGFIPAMEAAKTSYEADILSGFDLLHIDPSLNCDGLATPARSLQAACELISHCAGFARKNKKTIFFEVGTEENIGKATSSEVFEESLKKLIEFCDREGAPKPLFVVGQTGSLVKEMRQVGTFDGPKARDLARCAERHGVLLKEHNGDYLSAYQLLQRREAGIPAINVAPEFGVLESKAFVDMCVSGGRPDLAQRFLALSIQSRKWEKWVIDRRFVSDHDLGLISGHYVFATDEFGRLKAEIGAAQFDEAARGILYARIGFYCGDK